jgi:hypothetical protein
MVLKWAMIRNYELGRIWKDVVIVYLPGGLRKIMEESHSGQEAFRMRIKVGTS